MLQSKYLTQDGLNSYFKECHRMGFNYVFYNTSFNCYVLSKEQPVFKDEQFLYCMGIQHNLKTYFSELVFTDLLADKQFIKFSDHIDCVDWENVPVDTKIIVSHSTGSPDYCRYFAEYKDGKVYAWDCGATSWSSDSKSKSWWEHAKLVK